MMVRSDSSVTRVLGIDEAGRGPVIGPLVICGFMLDEAKLPKLKELGVKDSKLLSPARRSFLYQKLKAIALDYVILKLSAFDIDKLRTETNLNKIEISRMHQLINHLEPDRVYIDAIEANTQAFCTKILKGTKQNLREKFAAEPADFVCENYADKTYPIVGAASIMAKVVRDAEVRKLHQQYGDFGSGYSSDPITIAFLKRWLQEHKELPPIVRRSWVTAKELKKDADQLRLQSFVHGKQD